MSTSVMNHKKTTIVYICVTIFCIVFNAIYEHFSYGEYSLHMRYMFIAPVLFGIIPFATGYLLTQKEKTFFLQNRISYNLWNCGIAIVLSGCIVRGIINISGRYADYYMIYQIGAGLFFLASILLRNKKIEKQTAKTESLSS